MGPPGRSTGRGCRPGHLFRTRRPAAPHTHYQPEISFFLASQRPSVEGEESRGGMYRNSLSLQKSTTVRCCGRASKCSKHLANSWPCLTCRMCPAATSDMNFSTEESRPPLPRSGTARIRSLCVSAASTSTSTVQVASRL